MGFYFFQNKKEYRFQKQNSWLKTYLHLIRRDHPLADKLRKTVPDQESH